LSTVRERLARQPFPRRAKALIHGRFHRNGATQNQIDPWRHELELGARAHVAVVCARNACSVPEQEVAGQVIDAGNRLKRRTQPIAVTGRQSLYRNGVGWRDTLGDVLDLL
jgi:hypothetical protein